MAKTNDAEYGLLVVHACLRRVRLPVISLNDTIPEIAGDVVPGVCRVYDHTEDDTVGGQDLIYTFYADNKTAYSLTYRLYEQHGVEDVDHDTKYDLARGILTTRRRGKCPQAHIPLRLLVRPRFWPSRTHRIPRHGGWIGPLLCNRKVTYADEEHHVDARAERIVTTERDDVGETYLIWTKGLHVSQLGDVKLVIAKRPKGTKRTRPRTSPRTKLNHPSST